MEVDATCIVQIGHFILAYYMLKHFLLKPLVNKVHEQDTLMKGLQEKIEIRRLFVQQQEQNMLNQWVAYQKQFADTIPKLQGADACSTADTMVSLHDTTLETWEKKRIIEKLKEEIIAKVRRVH